MSQLLVRQGLLTRLNKALDDGHVVVEAPAGYGKTILLQQMLSRRPHSHLLQLTVADNDLAVLQERLAPWLAADRLTQRTTLLLDDVHHLELEATAASYLQSLVDRHNPRLLLAGRRIPLPPGRLAALRHFRLADLAFAPAESGALLQKLPAPAAARWHEKLEGWPLGVGLLAQMRGGEQLAELARPQLFQYLAQHVVDELPAELVAFLRLTAVPLRFDDELAALLSGRSDAAAQRRELQRRNLFIYDDERPGWYRYHDLIREFILEREGAALQPTFRRAVDWFAQQGDLAMAVEHALDAGLHDLAAAQLLEALDPILHREGRIWTYRRWIERLDPHSRRPTLLRPFIRKLHEAGQRREAWRFMAQLLASGAEQGDRRQLAESYWLQGFLYFNESQHEASLGALTHAAAHDDGADPDFERRQSELLAHNLAGLNRLPEARHAYRRAIDLARRLDNEAALNYSRHNLVNLVLLRQGRLAESRRELLAGDDFFARSGPYLLAGHLLSWAELHQETGDWNALAAVLKEQEEVTGRLDEWIDDDRLYVLWSRALLYTGQGRFRRAQAALDEALALPVEDDLAQLCLAAAQAWLYRRKGENAAAANFASQALRQYHNWPFWRAVLALERELASAHGAEPLAAEIGPLLAARAAPHLARLRALFAIRCRRQDHPRWRRHFAAVLRALRRPSFVNLLTTRDPELGLAFWRIALLEDRCRPQADEALTAIGQALPLLELLKQDDAALRQRLAPILAAIGDERAMPALDQAARAEPDRGVRRALSGALQQLEALPPPPLQIQLMGAFRISRGGEPLPAAAFPRPIVLRLLQYFAVHRRRILPRDRILEDLWPGAAYDKAWASFRSVHSRLRKLLEPYMRSNGPVRYFSVEGESYQFDPFDVVAIDAEQFEQIVRDTLQEAAGAPIAPLPDELSAWLRRWQPLLPDLAYADWLAETRQRLHDAYVEGCLYVAQAHLQRDEPAAAITWAQRTVETAPWVESAYQTLMRAYARQGQRALALKAYSDAVQALAKEFAVAPSPLTDWLRSRLEAGDPI